MRLQIKNLNQNNTLADHCRIAQNFFTRLKGLLGKSDLEAGRGLLLKPCRSVHTCFMRFPIDVIFIDKDGEVLHLVENLKPFKTTPLVRKAYCALELPTGTVSKTGTSIGDKIIINRSDTNYGKA